MSAHYVHEQDRAAFDAAMEQGAPAEPAKVWAVMHHVPYEFGELVGLFVRFETAVSAVWERDRSRSKWHADGSYWSRGEYEITAEEIAEA